MTDEQALFRAILENPADDTLRLIYADVVEARGDGARAEFIRVQIATGELAPFSLGQSLRHTPDSPQKLIMAWLDSLGVEAGAFRRGWPSYLTLPTAAFLAHAAALGGAVPWERVTLSDREPQEYHNNGEGWLYGWWRGITKENRRCDLPWEIWDRLTVSPEGMHGDWADFTSPALAKDALSAGLVRILRSAAGLPPLTRAAGSESRNPVIA